MLSIPVCHFLLTLIIPVLIFVQFSAPALVSLMKEPGMQLEGPQRSQAKDNRGNWAELYFYGLLQKDWKDQ